MTALRRVGSLVPRRMKATLALENGIWYEGEAAGAAGETGGEVVFNTSMTGYQEVLTDPSYAGQIVTMTCPEIGNYGIVRRGRRVARRRRSPGSSSASESPVASNWRADSTLRDYLVRHGIVAISDIDTRALTRVLRSAGVMRGIIATGDVDPRALVERRATSRRWKARTSCAASPATRRSTGSPTRSTLDEFAPDPPSAAPGGRLQIAAYDFGMKWNILRRFTALRLRRPRVSRPTAPAADLLASSPTACSSATAPAIRRRSTTRSTNAQRRWSTSDVPVFGICLGHQILVARDGRRDLQAEVRPPRREPSGEGARDRQGRDHVAEPRLRGRSGVAAGGRAR